MVDISSSHCPLVSIDKDTEPPGDRIIDEIIIAPGERESSH